MDAENDVSTANWQDMEVCFEGMALYANGSSITEFVAFKFIPVANEDSQRRCGDGGEAQVADEASLHEVGHAADVDEDHDELTTDVAQ